MKTISNPVRHNGFTIIELIATVAVVATIAMIAYPEYQEFSSKVTRSEAINTIMRAVKEVERCGAGQGNIYDGCNLPDGTGVLPGGIQEQDLTQSPRGYYLLQVVPVADPAAGPQPGPVINAPGYMIIATRTVRQERDVSCLTPGNNNFELVYNSLGQVGIRDGGAIEFGTPQARRCWNK